MPQILVTGQAAIHFNGSQPTILQSLEQQQQDVSYQCREGYCGACRCKLIAGQIQYLHEPLAFVRHGEFLPCCSIPVTDIEIEIP
ncbi:class I ribonucleotide reductase maintenance protein YfaE [Arsukibacterium indicum]|uniref:2Fe-2S ferredoxin-like protein n=1 Tax=Arsukibacterium indicum TaxID=2848612 RepID=A0ABS6MM55_9GAMM|nr:class I ribonucleotide reductase maintenance protein YfaE [Arsukibacterium indicum]MBV2129892.1 2Fe-2S ferredoxin-like protein [Arsukibacterium indicum]